MEASEFIKLAEPDRSTTLDAIGNIIGPGYTSDIEPDKAENNLSNTEEYFKSEINRLKIANKETR